MSNDVAWYCQKCGRIEAPKDMKWCPICVNDMQRCSRYEWFLADEIRVLLDDSGRKYKIKEQYVVRDHRGFNWYWDLYIWVEGKSFYRGYGEVIDVQGPDHRKQKRYSGPGGGYTRDDDKHWETFSNQKLHKRGIDCRYVTNEQCKKKDGAVEKTAKQIVSDAINRSDNWC